MRRTLLALVPLLLLTGCAQDEPAPGALTATVVDPPFAIDGRPLVDTAGEPFSLTEDTDNRLTLVFFGYTRCPDVCPLIMQTLSSALTRLDDADREQVDVVFVSTDPATDTPTVLRSYLDRLDPSYIGLTADVGDASGEAGEADVADLDDIVAVASSAGIFVADAEQLDSGGYDLGSHGSQVLGIDPDDGVPFFWRPDTSSAQIAADLELLLGDT